MQELLAQLSRIRGIGGCVLVSVDGLPMDSTVRQGVDESRLAAALSTFTGPAAKLAELVGAGAMKQMSINGPAGGLLTLQAGPAHLVLLIDAGANLTLLQLEAGPVVERIAQRLAL